MELMDALQADDLNALQGPESEGVIFFLLLYSCAKVNYQFHSLSLKLINTKNHTFLLIPRLYKHPLILQKTFFSNVKSHVLTCVCERESH